MTTTIRPLEPELTTLLFSLGGRKLVLAEGPDDTIVYNLWFQHNLADLYFHEAGGYPEIEHLFNDIQAQRSDVHVYAIRDRDFCSDVNTANQISSRFFILPLYSIENYLLSPEAVQSELSTYFLPDNHLPNRAAAEAKLLELCNDLAPMMAGNWLLLEYAKKGYADGHPIQTRQEVITKVSQRLGYNTVQTEAELAPKESDIATQLGSIATAYKRISGKHILFHLRKWAITKQQENEANLPRKFLFRLLARWHFEHDAVPADVRFIMEQCILQV